MRDLLKLSIPTVAVSVVLAACGSSSSSNTTSASSAQPATQTTGGSTAVVKTAPTSSHGTILVNSQGMTLYHLSGEQSGKLICTSSACVAVWHPLTVTAGTTPSGTVASIGTITRPDGTVQVAYKGEPLYTFAQDRQPGETNGQGIKDVGTWTVITTGSAVAAPTTSTPTTSTSSSESHYGY
jgi:predicted lipoprotein with Yx(FWY)xxD motif